MSNSAQLQGAEILDIIEDDTGVLWLDCDRLLFRYDPATKALRRFGLADGYPITPRGIHSLKGTESAFLPRKGLIVIGTGDGIVIFKPQGIRSNPVPPSVVISDILVPSRTDGGTVMSPVFRFHPPEHLDLPYDRSAVEIVYAALDFTSPPGNTYAVKLEGVDRDWVQMHMTHSIRYGTLLPGDYRFRVKAANSDGIWSAQNASFSITVLPPWWKSPGAYVGYIALAGMLLYLAYRARIARLKALERLRLNIAGDLHDEIGTGLSSIALQTELLSRTQRPATEQGETLADIVKTARTLADSTRDVVWVLAPQHERLSDLVLKMRTEAPRVLAVEDPGFAEHLEHPEVILSTEARKHILLMYKEILHNVHRHAHAERVSIEVNEQLGVFQLIVRDSGVGFVPENANTGHGLKSLDFRAKELGGKLTITSVAGKGTRVQFAVELTRLRD
ncbi:MAG: triple tyrosine motif-containing protein [Ignavibacteriales bacterium]|nr:triple tyrosine motif-containing protein [Ignavibacteriales bacterium]